MNNFGILFVGIVCLSYGAFTWLGARNSAHVRANHARLPAILRENIQLTAHQRGAQYTLARQHLTHATAVLDTCLLLAWTVGGGFRAVDGAWSELALTPLVKGLAVIGTMMVATYLLRLPLHMWETFGIGQAFGLNRMTLGSFAADRLKRATVRGTLNLCGAAVAIAIINASGPHWWIMLWGAWTICDLALLWLHPIAISPWLDSRYTPMDSTLSGRLFDLAKRAGLPVDTVLVAETSGRSLHANARVQGIGTHRQIVLNDTLTTLLTASEVEAVVAHELGHLRHRHVITYFAITAAARLILLLFVMLLSINPWFLSGLALSPPSAHAMLIAIVALYIAGKQITRPIDAHIRRAFEYDADAFASGLGTGATLSRALVKLHRNNLTSLTPDPLYAALLLAHPPLRDRMDRLSRSGS